MKKLMILVGLLVFSVFAFTRLEVSDGARYRAQIAELRSTVDEHAAEIAELKSELECYEEEEEPCSSS